MSKSTRDQVDARAQEFERVIALATVEWIRELPPPPDDVVALVAALARSIGKTVGSVSGAGEDAVARLNDIIKYNFDVGRSDPLGCDGKSFVP